MPDFTPTPEQLAIVEAAQSTPDNLLVSALAGGAKTSTLELIAAALPEVNIVCLAFNRSIAEEMKLRLPANCTAMTLNSLGHRVWGQRLGKRLQLKKTKMYGIITSIIEGLIPKEREEAWGNLKFLLDSCDMAKASGHLPNSIAAKHPKANRLLDDEDLLDSLQEKSSDNLDSIIIEALTQSAEQALQGTIDFGDQVLFPSIFRCVYPIFSCILVDEAQDLSALNHLMLRQLYRKRIIAVGDQCQAIYAFRGAYENGMAAIAREFSCRELPLSVSFRCPEEIVDHVRWRAPHMQSWEGTPSGTVATLHTWDFTDIPAQCAVICRNNAPLFDLAINLLRAGRYPNLWGNDIAKGLLKTLSTFGEDSTPQETLLSKLESWQVAREKKVKKLSQLRDKVECLRILIGQGETLRQVLAYTQELFRIEGSIHLTTGHKAKGHEFDHVFFLDEDLVSDKGQDPNLRYVICTRAKRSLTYIKSDGCVEFAEDAA
jgi:superfamily I DNA/RNA helicase